MGHRSGRAAGLLVWGTVLVIGGVILAVVFGLNLYPRLVDAGTVLNGLSPAFSKPRVEGTAAGLSVVSDAVDVANPIMTPSGGAQLDIAHLLAFLSARTKVPEARLLAILQARFPHAAGLLEAVPLSQVSTELPGLEAYLASLLHMSPVQVAQVLRTQFPALSLALTNLPAVTSGWNNIPGVSGLTTFSGVPVKTVPQLRNYFADDVVPVLATQRTNFERLKNDWPPVSGIPIWLTVLAGVLILLGIAMIARWRMGIPARSEAAGEVLPVFLLGLLTLGFVFGLGMFPRLDGGQKLLDAAAPIFAPSRVAGDVGGVAMVSRIADVVDPIVAPQGGAAAEVPKLLALVSAKTGLPVSSVITLLKTHFPHVAGLLEAIPLSAVTAELPGLESFIASLVHITPAGVATTISRSFPALAGALAGLPAMTANWYSIPGIDAMTTFGPGGVGRGSPIETMPEFVGYLSHDLVPAVASVQADIEVVVSTTPPLTAFPPALTVAGGLITLYGAGLLVLLLAREPEPQGALRLLSGGPYPSVEPMI